MMAAITFGQDLPENPETGKCYVRCKTPDVWKNETINVAVAPEFKKIITSIEINTSMRKLCSSAAICINRTLTIEAAVPGAVVLDAMNEKRVFEIQPGGMAELIGLNITGGSTNSVCSVLGL